MKLHKWEDVEALAKPEVIARARARTEFSEERSAERWLELLTEVVERG